jgi:hypothetical protein
LDQEEPANSGPATSQRVWKSLPHSSIMHPRYRADERASAGLPETSPRPQQLCPGEAPHTSAESGPSLPAASTARTR